MPTKATADQTDSLIRRREVSEEIAKRLGGGGNYLERLSTPYTSN